MIALRCTSAFQEMRDAKLLSDLPQVARFAGLVRQGRGATDYFEVGDFGQVGENLILDAAAK
jgi:hypothetical protein